MAAMPMPNAVNRLRAVALASFGLALLACRDPVGTCACTEEFRIFMVTVVDDTGAPVADVALTRTHLRTGAVIEPTWLGMSVPGTYVVADDGQRDVFSSGGDALRVRGERGGAVFVADFVFAVPEPCRCHVERLAGPDTVVMSAGT